MVTFVTYIIKSTAKLRNYFHNTKLKYEKNKKNGLNSCGAGHEPNTQRVRWLMATIGVKI